MGSSNGVSRGQLRPHFGGRNPPFLVAALCVGLGILAVSYYSLSSQYTALQMQLEAFGKEEQLIETQLHAKEDECAKNRLAFEKKQKEFEEALQQVKNKEQEISKLNAQLSSVRDTNDKYNEEIVRKENEIGDAKTKIQDLEKSIASLERQLNKEKEKNTQLKTQVDELQKMRSTSAPQVLPKSDDKSKIEAANSNKKSEVKVVENKTIGEELKPVKVDGKHEDQVKVDPPVLKNVLPTEMKKGEESILDENLKKDNLLMDTYDDARDKMRADGDENVNKDGESA